MSIAEQQPAKPDAGPRYFIDIEGTDYAWDEGTISVPQIRELGRLTGSEPIVEVDLKENTERTLAEDAVVDIEPGRGFAKKVRFKRG